MTSGPSSEAGGPAPPLSLGTIPPRLVVALALVGAGGVALVAVLVTMATVPDGTGLGLEIGVLQRMQLGTRFLDVGLLVLVPLAVLLAGLVEPGTAPAEQATRAVLTGASAVGASLVFFVALRLLANLGGGDLVGPSTAGVLLYDLACLLVAGVGALWAYEELRRRRPKSSTPAPSSPPPPAAPGGFPQGPPLAGPPAPAEPSA